MVALCYSPSVRGEPVTIPQVGRPEKDFYGASGSPVRVRFEADRVNLRKDESLTLTLIVSNLLNPQDVQPPKLNSLVDFQRHFQIDAPSEENPIEKNERRFRYRLQPRSSGTIFIPRFIFRYYHPGFGQQPDSATWFPSARTDPIEIIVTEPEQKVVLPVPMLIPEFTETIETDLNNLKERPSWLSERWSWFAIILTPPILVIGGLVVWQWRYPDEARLARLRRNRAARQALDAMRRARSLPRSEQPIVLVQEMKIYLCERFGISSRAGTPAEMEQALTEVGLPVTHQSSIGDFFRQCETSRFAPAASNDRLAEVGESLIVQLESTK
jgi:hypothetical protein